MSATGSHPSRAPTRERSGSVMTKDTIATDIESGKRKKSENMMWEGPRSGREWWRSWLKETPVPGTYESRDFLEDQELNPVPITYNFKNEGRKKDADVLRRGDTLLPGAYNLKDFLYPMQKSLHTYSFKNSNRDNNRVLIGVRDKDHRVAPWEYETRFPPVQKSGSKHSMFRSSSQRVPKYFVPKDGPGPGDYEYRPPSTAKTVTSSFRSRTPRFPTSHTKVPGPGSYQSTYQYPKQPATVSKMGRHHGLFFTNSFDVVV
ncbi:protein STPG4-like isoform X1 [Branchiostoma lanceolatum]|uniref:C2orf61 protein n=1 Tax=Branchiostoma lanceolatum TaxID=7740 RepID=A0A8J9ZTX6_BRALA|nr:C2orf61 [Branchiostoma lanceolatum]